MTASLSPMETSSRFDDDWKSFLGLAARAFQPEILSRNRERLEHFLPRLRSNDREDILQKSAFIYVTYIRTTPEKLWQALTAPGFNRRFFFGATRESEWKKGAAWRLMIPDGRFADGGEILEIDPPRRLVLKWRNEMMPELHRKVISA